MVPHHGVVTYGLIVDNGDVGNELGPCKPLAQLVQGARTFWSPEVASVELCFVRLHEAPVVIILDRLGIADPGEPNLNCFHTVDIHVDDPGTPIRPGNSLCYGPLMDLGLDGARAIITGGSRGIGRSMAERLLMEGAEVTFCARNPETIEVTVNKLSPLGSITGTSIDVSNHDALAEWVTAYGEAGGIDIVVSNASALGGISRDNDGWRKSFEVDVLSATTMFDAALPFLKASDRASFLQLSTITAVEYHGYPGGGLSYGAVKAALVNYVKQLAIEYAADGIRANCIAPGPIYIEDGSWGKIKKFKEDYYQANVDSHPGGRMGTPEEVANVGAFIASPLASWVTGQHIVIDGGFTRRV